VHCEPLDGVDTETLATRVHEAIRQRIGISVTVVLRAPGEVPRSEGKAVRVIDKR
jgi:phenylacetate-CoA ligase